MDYFKKEVLKAAEAEIARQELLTDGEIRVAIIGQDKKKDKDKTLYQLALGLFYKLEMQNTIGRSAVLLYIHTVRRQFQIIADEGVHSKVGQSAWDEIANDLKEAFQYGHYQNGLLSSIQKIGSLLATHFPPKSENKNELTNEIFEN
ncbi:MAG TPA: hypothetical protein ENN84_00530 [Candidatus Marinimicrobia bacterium]|nr:hypothetical protein [Candidatus Neomarinimicrobiota bacterium]